MVLKGAEQGLGVDFPPYFGCVLVRWLCTEPQRFVRPWRCLFTGLSVTWPRKALYETPSTVFYQRLMAIRFLE